MNNYHVSHVMDHVSCVTCHISCFACHLPITPTATVTEPLPGNSHTMCTVGWPPHMVFQPFLET